MKEEFLCGEWGNGEDPWGNIEVSGGDRENSRQKVCLVCESLNPMLHVSQEVIEISTEDHDQ